jgi:pRiA4b ORF-3-like protein
MPFLLSPELSQFRVRSSRIVRSPRPGDNDFAAQNRYRPASEDVGGIPGYEDFLEALKDANHPEHEEYLDWIGGDFDPEAFDVNEPNRLLRAMR